MPFFMHDTKKNKINHHYEHIIHDTKTLKFLSIYQHFDHDTKHSSFKAFMIPNIKSTFLSIYHFIIVGTKHSTLNNQDHQNHLQEIQNEINKFIDLLKC